MGSIDENKILVKQYYEEVVNTGDVRRVPDFISPDYVEVYENERFRLGIEGAKDHINGVRRVYSGLHLTIERQIAEGDWVVSVVTARGTHTGEWIGIKPTGKAVLFTSVNVDRVAGGLIVEHGGAANLLFPLLEIGAVKIVSPGK